MFFAIKSGAYVSGLPRVTRSEYEPARVMRRIAQRIEGNSASPAGLPLLRVSPCNMLIAAEFFRVPMRRRVLFDWVSVATIKTLNGHNVRWIDTDLTVHFLPVVLQDIAGNDRPKAVAYKYDAAIPIHHFALLLIMLGIKFAQHLDTAADNRVPAHYILWIDIKVAPGIAGEVSEYA